MYKFRHSQEEFESVYLPFGGKLKSDNRWVRLAKLIPWGEFEGSYCDHFSKPSKCGASSISLRIALGSLIIQEKLGTSDEKTLLHITENPYLQYFLGFEAFIEKAPFDSSMFIYFRKRLGKNILREVNEAIARGAAKMIDGKDEYDSDGSKEILKVDATCAPFGLKYPTDLNLLNEGREKLEEIIDTLCDKTNVKKPRTYRKKARRVYLATAKKRDVHKRQMSKAIGKQLCFIRRNLKSIKRLCNSIPPTGLSTRSYNDLFVVSELYRQQNFLYSNKVHIA